VKRGRRNEKLGEKTKRGGEGREDDIVEHYIHRYNQIVGKFLNNMPTSYAL
jgi:hypothetical protein